MICEEYNKKSGLRCIYKAKTVGFDGKNVCKLHNKRKSDSNIHDIIQSENMKFNIQKQTKVISVILQLIR